VWNRVEAMQEVEINRALAPFGVQPLRDESDDSSDQPAPGVYAGLRLVMLLPRPASTEEEPDSDLR
jgi:hypothetical protein